MIVSWNWLKQYVLLDMPLEELQRRLMMAGLNHEETTEAGGDLAIDLEVTSNRPDCLGHLGVAREIAVLWQRPLQVPAAQPRQGPTPVEDLVRVRIDCPELCLRYTARVVRGLKVGPSPKWLARRLETVGIAAINNVVDISNYVLMECGQPLHTFDYAKLDGPEIIVRRPQPGEAIEAIDHKTYALEPDMCVIADAREPVAIGGVMGGAGTEVQESTRDVLVEAAEFDPISIRSTARRLNLHSDSSYRFERRVDPEGIDWASRRCCELMLELAGGELAAGVIDVGPAPPPRQPITLRLSQLPRILGIEIDLPRVREILAALGNVEVHGAEANGRLTVVPPSWRRDLSREIDLIEEVARIHGYEQIPEDVSVPMAPSVRRREDRVAAKIRHVLTASGFDEAMTLSVVDEASARVMSPWTAAEPLRGQMPVIRGADRLRTSLVPSLLGARRINEALSNPRIELFEIAKIYLPNDAGLPDEQLMLGISSGRDYPAVKGVIEAIVAALDPAAQLESADADVPLLDPAAACCLQLAGQRLGYVGRLRPEGLKQLDVRGATTVAELRLAPLIAIAKLIPQYVPLPPYPAVTRDLNLVVHEAVRWSDVAVTVRDHGGPHFEGLDYRDTYRDPERLGTGKKSLLLTMVLRSKEGTLTSQEADAVCDSVVEACRRAHGAELRA
ncbi:MAG: phenylalanine--tRNA ligase subunit beta [Thermoguttaceae bacterium]|jgi:phenylalanyl-tRNA synthetase beta chain